MFHCDSNELLHAQHYPAVPLPAASSENAALSAAHRPQGPQTPRRVAPDGAKPPKKPLTPYMIFSKRVSTLLPSPVVFNSYEFCDIPLLLKCVMSRILA